MWALRPEALDHASLPEAISRFTARWAEESGIGAQFTVTGEPYPRSPEVEVTLLRSAQEALANVRKHARASHVTITLSYMDDLTVLDVQDDGVGFDPSLAPNGATEGDEGGYGLQAMHQRVEQLGGRLLVESAPGRGATLAVELPA